ncbi:MAG: hypothetical protein ACXW32_07955, partial [Limisphaerales bacterium]
ISSFHILFGSLLSFAKFWQKSFKAAKRGLGRLCTVLRTVARLQTLAETRAAGEGRPFTRRRG